MKSSEPAGCMHLTYHRAGEEDRTEIQRLARLIWQEAYSELLSEEQISYMLELMYSGKVILQELLSGVVWEIIFDAGKACGYLSYAFAEDNSVKLSKIYIQKEARGNLIAAESISRVLKFATDNKKDYVFLTVNKNNKRAIRAYEKNGFTITDTVITDIGNGFFMDDFVMKFRVTPQQG